MLSVSSSVALISLLIETRLCAVNYHNKVTGSVLRLTSASMSATVITAAWER